MHRQGTVRILTASPFLFSLCLSYFFGTTSLSPPLFLFLPAIFYSYFYSHFYSLLTSLPSLLFSLYNSFSFPFNHSFLSLSFLLPSFPQPVLPSIASLFSFTFLPSLFPKTPDSLSPLTPTHNAP